MAANGINAVRTYTVPPRWLLDLRPRERPLGDGRACPGSSTSRSSTIRAAARSIAERVAAGVRACAGHPAILCYAIGNEIPASIVRWHGRRAHRAVPGAALRGGQGGGPRGARHVRELPEHRVPPAAVHRPRLLQRLPRVRARSSSRTSPACRTSPATARCSSPRPASTRCRNGEAAQARALDWQVRTAFAAGCAGTFVFAWTDEWYRGGFEIDDWAFGLVDRERAAQAGAREPSVAPSPRRRSRAIPPGPGSRWWCAPTTARTRCATASTGCAQLDYPDYEVIVVNDGSTDRDRRDHARVRLPADQHREPRARERAQLGPARRDRRDRRLHRRRRAAPTRTGSRTSRPPS